MKGRSFALGALVLLSAVAAVPIATAYAAADATCVSDPSSGPVGTVFAISCSGYDPNVHVYAYLVEPSGAANQLFDSRTSTNFLTDKRGSFIYSQESNFGESSLQTGTWHFVAEQLGPAHTVVHRGETTFTVTGGTEGVSGASLTANPGTIHKPEQGYAHAFEMGVTYNFYNYSDPVTISGGGFTPGEMVTFWAEPPGGGCPSFTSHNNVAAGVVVPGLVARYLTEVFNYPLYDGIGSSALGSVRAGAGGSVSLDVFFNMTACEGMWHFAARGNTSGAGGETFITVIGNEISTNAWLSADPETVTALFGTVTFSGSGFGADERLSCWLTSPQGRTLGFPDDWFGAYSTPGAFLRNRNIMTDAGGNVSFSLVTGSLYVNVSQTLTSGGTTDQLNTTYSDPVASEGALGVYAMTCRGDTSDATAIANFTLTGGFVDP